MRIMFIVPEYCIPPPANLCSLISLAEYLQYDTIKRFFGKKNTVFNKKTVIIDI